MSVLDRATLEESTLADLHAIASELSIDGYRRLRKADLIETLLEHQGGEAAGRDEEDEDGATAASRRRRGRRGGRGRGGATTRTADDAEPDDEVEEEEEDEQPVRSRRSRGRGGRGGRSGDDEARGDRESRGDREPRGDRESRGDREPRGDRESRGDREPRGEQEAEPVEGVVELLANGSGFLRVSPPEPSDDDVYISAAQVKRCELVNGDRVSGPRRAPHRSERYPSLIRIDTVNGSPAAELAERGRFEDLPVAFPTERFKLGSADETLKAIEFLTPFGRGSRVLITGGTWAGKSHSLLALAQALKADTGVSVLVALAGVRPEEIGEWAAGDIHPVAAVSFAASAEAQDNAVELVVDQAKRLAARGESAVVLIDTLDGLHPLSARRALAAARNIVGGGSLTVIATASEPLGGETTLISLDAKLASTGRFPALDLAASGTLRPELLVGDAGAKAIAKERAKALK